MENHGNFACVVTGCGSGIGLALTELLLEQGYPVIGSWRETKPPIENPRFELSRMDLRIDSEIEAFADFVKEKCVEREWTLQTFVSNSGVALGGPFESIPIATMKEAMQINLFGAALLTQRLLPLLIGGRGRIGFIGSLAGKVALPFLSPYASSKFALEGFCDCLRRELNPYGVRTILFEPGAVATPIWEKAKKVDMTRLPEKYRASMEAFQRGFVEGGSKGMNPGLAAKQIMRGLFAKNPRPRYIVSSGRFRDWLKTKIPARLLDRFVVGMFDMHYGE